MLDVVPTKHRSLVLLAAVLLVQVLLLAVQIRRSEDGRGDVRLIRVWAVWMVSPFQRGGAWLVDTVSGAWGGYVDLRDIREENRRLHSELSGLKLRNQDLESRAAEAARLAALVEFRAAHQGVSMLAARVVGAGAAVAGSRLFYIDRGERDGVQRNMAVITPDGVVGKTLSVFADTAQVLLITDKESGVGSLFAESRTHGVVRGQGEPWLLMDYVVNDEPVLAGQRIVTSGEDRVFPKDLPVGTVLDAAPGTPFQKVRVRPAARLDRLEEVLILLSRQELLPAAAETQPQPGSVPAKQP
jgi:rod shape-determining protein MreC